MNKNIEDENQYRWYFDKAIKYSNEKQGKCLSEIESLVIDKANFLLKQFEKNKQFNQNYNKSTNQFPLLTAGKSVLKTNEEKKIDIIHFEISEKESSQDSDFSHE